MPIVQIQQKKPKKKPSKLPVKLIGLLTIVIASAFIVAPRLQDRGSPALSSVQDFNKKQYSPNDPSSIWAVVNKGRALPADYVPADLTAPNVQLRLPASDPEMQIRLIAAGSLQQMFKDASDHNIQLMLSSGYRSYALQNIVYRGNVNLQGQETADSSSAKPGHSEHQTGLAVDIEPISRECEVELCFADTPEGKWLAANSYKYGFIIRYQKDSEKLTGYEYEPWHVRYIGVELAQKIHSVNQTLEQFFGLPAEKDYSSSPFQLKIGT